MAPFPWTTTTNTAAARKGESAQHCSITKGYEDPSDSKVDSVSRNPGIKSMYNHEEPGAPISYNLPADGSLAGKVLLHASREMEKLFRKHEPMIWKVGYTHNPLWRWTNDLYGYSSARDKWSSMVVLYISKEPFGPAMLEAALIDKFRSISPASSYF